MDLLNKTVSKQMSYVWVTIGILFAIYIIFYNIRMQKITNRMIAMIDQSKKRCDDLLMQVRNSKSIAEINELIKEFENEASVYLNFKNNKKQWPLQTSRIMRHIKEIRTYITSANEIKKTIK